MILSNFFGHDLDFDNAVSLFSIHHFIYVLCGISSIALILTFAEKLKNLKKEILIKRGLAIFLVILELSYHIHNWTYPRLSIPLHICSFATFMAIYILFTDNQRIFKYLFFFGVLGGSMALITPLSYGYSYLNFRYYHFILLHCLIITIPLYYYKAYNYRVTYRNLWTVFKSILLISIVIYLINRTFMYFGIESNYWYISVIPDNVSMFFQIYPLYIVLFMTTVFTTMNILYFVSKDSLTDELIHLENESKRELQLQLQMRKTKK
jgi:hypothetical integral membrane protein (TIGR02206 family)